METDVDDGCASCPSKTKNSKRCNLNKAPSAVVLALSMFAQEWCP